MIRIGIVSYTLTHREELLIKLLLHHPDVKLHAVITAGKQQPLSQVFLSLTGETQLITTTLNREGGELDLDAIDWSEMNMVFAVESTGAVNADALYSSIRAKCDTMPIVWVRLKTDTDGLPELHRRQLVKVPEQVNIPSASAVASLLALLPMARNLMVNAPVDVTIERFATNLPAESQQNVERAIADTLQEVQSSFNSPVSVKFCDMSNPRGGMKATVSLTSSVDMEMLRRIYDDYYDDHNFTYVVDRMPETTDVIGTNKCLLYLDREGDKVVITSVIDDFIKGDVGNAVHVMNLLFGLHELVGLTL